MQSRPTSAWRTLTVRSPLPAAGKASSPAPWLAAASLQPLRSRMRTEASRLDPPACSSRQFSSTRLLLSFPSRRRDRPADRCRREKAIHPHLPGGRKSATAAAAWAEVPTAPSAPPSRPLPPWRAGRDPFLLDSSPPTLGTPRAGRFLAGPSPALHGAGATGAAGNRHPLGVLTRSRLPQRSCPSRGRGPRPQNALTRPDERNVARQSGGRPRRSPRPGAAGD